MITVSEQLAARKQAVLSFLHEKENKTKDEEIKKMYALMQHYYQTLYQGFPTDIPEGSGLAKQIQNILDKHYDLIILKTMKDRAKDNKYENALQIIVEMNLTFLLKDNLFAQKPWLKYLVYFVVYPLSVLSLVTTVTVISLVCSLYIKPLLLGGIIGFLLEFLAFKLLDDYVINPLLKWLEDKIEFKSEKSANFIYKTNIGNMGYQKQFNQDGSEDKTNIGDRSNSGLSYDFFEFIEYKQGFARFHDTVEEFDSKDFEGVFSVTKV